MNYVFVAISAYVLNGFSVLTDKFLLTKKIAHPISYVFYISAASLIVLLAIPFTTIPSLYVFLIASVSTIFWTIGAYFLFSALKTGLASRVAPIIGTLTPLMLIVYYSFFSSSISLNQVWGALISTLGLMALIFEHLKSYLNKERKKNRRKEFVFEFFSGLFFAISYIFLKIVFDNTSFITGIVWSRFILIPIAIIILLIPSLKKLVFSSKKDKIKFFSKTGLLFLSGQISGGLSQLLLSFAISLANPALVNSLQGTQYAFLFLASLTLKKRFPKSFNESYSKRIIIQKTIGILLIGLGLYVMAFITNTNKKVSLGLTYSPRYAKSLNLNPLATYDRIIRDLSPSEIRLPIYWDEIYKTKSGDPDFTSMDYYVKRAENSGTKLTLAIGYKVPRYPECFIPAWARSLSDEEFDNSLFLEIKTIVERYKNSPALNIWQVENEPLFPFGQCPQVNINRLKKEIDIVRETDPAHPTMITESGEFGLWINAPKNVNMLGISIYRRQLSPYVSWFKSPLPPFFYQLKTSVFNLLHKNKKVIVSELQNEPWSNSPLTETPISYQLKVAPVSDIKNNIEFSKNAGFDTVYLWGVEWWYYIKEKGYPEYLDTAIQVFQKENSKN